TRASQYRILGTSREEMCRLADGAFERLGPVPERRAAARRFVRELCLAGYGLGWVAGAVRVRPDWVPERTPRHDAAVSTLVEAGFGKEPTAHRWRARWDALLDVAWTAVDAGYARSVPVRRGVR